MEVLFQSHYLKVCFNSQNTILHTYWQTQADMEEEDYRQVLLDYLHWVHITLASKVIIDARKSTYSIPIETQKWINENIYIPAVAAGVRRLAYIISEDFFTQLSLELIVEDTDKEKFEDVFVQKFFTQESEAVAWLSQD
ncbi:MAG: hypothetical protein MUE85_17715 [Microscillaceae bacterium]|jgi:hypothetical protein|nr:hypothetical protein [Microscillaceae bacterium]